MQRGTARGRKAHCASTATTPTSQHRPTRKLFSCCRSGALGRLKVCVMDQSEVKALIAAEAPHWADLPIRPIRSSGTDSSCGAATAYSLGREPQENKAKHMTSRGAATAKRGQLHLLSPLRGFVACVREYLGLIVDILGWLGSKSRGTSGKAPSCERLGARCRSTASHPLPISM